MDFHLAPLRWEFLMCYDRSCISQTFEKLKFSIHWNKMAIMLRKCSCFVLVRSWYKNINLVFDALDMHSLEYPVTEHNIQVFFVESNTTFLHLLEAHSYSATIWRIAIMLPFSCHLILMFAWIKIFLDKQKKIDTRLTWRRVIPRECCPTLMSVIY